jgi:hypothetical protein
MSKLFITKPCGGILAAALVFLLFDTSSYGQFGAAPRTVKHDATKAESPVDRFLADLLIIRNRGEIDIAHKAEAVLTVPATRKLAARFQHDHAQFVDDLRRVTKMPAMAADGAPAEIVHLMSPSAIRPGDVLRFVQDVTERMGAMMDRDLKLQQGVAIDQMFLDAQEPLHIEMLATLQAAGDRASPPLKRVIEQGVMTTEKHIKEIRDLKREFASVASRSAAPSSGVRR